MSDPRLIFSGNNSASPQDICSALGWMDHDQNATSNLVGAVMTLCNRVAQLEARIEQLETQT